MLNWLFGAVWFALAIAIVGIASIPVTVEAQLAVAIATLAILALLRFTRLNIRYRQLYVFLTLLVVVRYFSWRIVSTVPLSDNLFNFVPAIFLLVAELYCLLMLLMSLFVILKPTDRKRVPFSDAEAPTVDVFVPSYNEDEDLLAVTLSAARAMDYPPHRLNVFLLDDGGTDQRIASENQQVAEKAKKRRASLQAICRELGVTYLTRAQNISAKAGNLNSGLSQSRGDLIAVFDADHAPARDFLRETVGPFLHDAKLFLVQTPHFFLNPDPLEKNLKTFGTMPSENEMFYGLVQRGLDSWNAAFFCGSAAVLRRSAIEGVGGFAGASITEDCETALELHSRNWNSIFIDRPMIAGLQPHTFESFVGQRTRWSQGMTQLLLLKNPLLRPGLTLAQRICYLSSILYWLFPLARLTFIFAPFFFIFFDLKIYTANHQEFLAYTVPYMAAAVMLQNHNFGRLRWPWVSEVYEYVQSVYLALPLLSVFLNPRKPSFNVTSKVQTLDEDGLSALAGPQFGIYALVLLSAVVLVYRYMNEAVDRDLIAVVGLWTALNLAVTSVGLGVVAEIRERRSSPRRETLRGAQIHGADGQVVSAMIDDMSIRGAALRIAASDIGAIDAAAPMRLSVDVSESGHEAEPPVAFQVRSRVHGAGHVLYGVEFEGSLTTRARLVADVMHADLASLRLARSRRNVDPGVIKGTFKVLSWSFGQPPRVLALIGARLSRRARDPRGAPSGSTAPLTRHAESAAVTPKSKA